MPLPRSKRWRKVSLRTGRASVCIVADMTHYPFLHSLCYFQKLQGIKKRPASLRVQAMRQPVKRLSHDFTVLLPISATLLVYERLQLRLESAECGSRGGLLGKRLVYIDLNKIRQIGIDR